QYKDITMYGAQLTSDGSLKTIQCSQVWAWEEQHPSAPCVLGWDQLTALKVRLRRPKLGGSTGGGDEAGPARKGGSTTRPGEVPDYGPGEKRPNGCPYGGDNGVPTGYAGRPFLTDGKGGPDHQPKNGYPEPPSGERLRPKSESAPSPPKIVVPRSVEPIA